MAVVKGNGGDACLIDILRRHADRQPEHPAYEFEGRTIRFGELEIATNRLANRMAESGIGAGDRIVYMGRNSDAYFILFFAAMKAGAHVVPVGWRLAQPEARHIIEDSEPVLVVVGPGGEAMAESLLRSPGQTPILFSHRDQSFDNWFANAPERAPDHVPTAGDMAVQIYTAGTTGRPKGAMLTQRCFVKQLESVDQPELAWNRWTKADVSYLPMPVSHIGGTGWGVWGVYFGAHTVIDQVFDIETTFDRLEHNGITKLFVVPAALQMMVRHPRARKIDFSRLSQIYYGASPITPALLRECVDVFGCDFAQFYGMTETVGGVTALTPQDHTAPGLPKIRSAGRPLPGVEIDIVRSDGTRCGPDAIGEILVRAACLMQGYWRLPEATAETIDADGFLHTGDAGYLDADGYLYIHDRIKDMIVSGGENVYSVEVESVLSEHDAVADVAVIGIPSDRWGEEVAAFIVMRDGASASEEALSGFARQKLAGFKIPRSYFFVGELPRSPAGKVLKRELRARFWDQAERQV